MAQHTGVVASLVYPSALDALWITVRYLLGLCQIFYDFIGLLPVSFCLLRKPVMNFSP